MPHPVEHLNSSQVADLLAAADDTRDRAILVLFLNTGVFLSELIDLKVDSIDWENKILKISGSRPRQLPLNDQAFDALAKWSQERANVPTNNFFITTKGQPKQLSDRAVDKIIRQAASRAKIKSKVNAQVLRNTFAIRLFTKEKTVARAAEILGISDAQSISRYINAAKQIDDTRATPAPAELQHVATQSKLAALSQCLFPTKPKIVKPSNIASRPTEVDFENIIIGREKIIEEIKTQLNHKQSVLLHGRLGVGKTHILKYIAKTLGDGAVYFPSPTPIKPLLLGLCAKLKSSRAESINSRSSTQQILDCLIDVNGSGIIGTRPILIIDNLNNLRSADMEIFLTLLQNFIILTAADEKTAKLDQVWWKFKLIEANPLPKDAAKELIRALTANLSISDYDLLETRILTLSDGLPLAIVDMTKQLSHHHVVTRDAIREIYHEAGVRYRDWTSAVVILWAAIIMFRFIALGTHSFESYILAGFGMSVIMVMKYFAARGR
jgi:hypothetical protein